MLPLGLIELAFDPVVQVGELGIRWQTIGVTVALLLALALAGTIAGRDRRRVDDLAYIVMGAVPGAVVGGRLLHGAAYWEAYAQDPQRLLDPGLGSLSLLGAVLGGAISGAYIVSLLGASWRRWADVAAIPLMLAIGLGKLAQLLGGSGQGSPFDGAWAVAFVSAGPWHSLSPGIAAHPSQVYEGLWMLIGIPVVLVVAVAGRNLGRRLPGRRRSAPRPRATGVLFVLALEWFLLGRVLIGFTWRDDVTVGPLNPEQAFAVAALIALVVGFAALAVHDRRARGRRERGSPAEPVAGSG